MKFILEISEKARGIARSKQLTEMRVKLELYKSSLAAERERKYDVTWMFTNSKKPGCLPKPPSADQCEDSALKEEYFFFLFLFFPPPPHKLIQSFSIQEFSHESSDTDFFS